MNKRIAILGSPGSGKSKLALGLREALLKEGTEYHIIDDYIKEVEDFSNLAMGSYADYIGNLYALLGRLAAERKEEGNDTITVGTIMESIIYTTIDAVNRNDDAAFVRIQNFMHLSGVIYQDTWSYDYVMVIRHDHEPESLPARVDNMLQEALDSFGVRYYVLRGTDDEKLERATKIAKGECVDCGEKNKAQGLEQPGIRGSGVEDEEVVVRPVPDLSSQEDQSTAGGLGLEERHL